MKDSSDVIVIGAGPCGSFAAMRLAKLGVSVTVFEERKEIGIPSHCAGHVSIEGLKQLSLYPLPGEIIENTFQNVDFVSPTCDRFSIHFSDPVTCTVNRSLFDKHIAHSAENAGASLLLNSRVESLFIEGRVVRGVVVRQEGKSKKRRARLVVDAEGISSRILRETGLTGLNRDGLINGVEAEVENVRDVEPHTIEVFLGRSYAPGFFAWLIPKSDGKAKIGLATKYGDPKDFLHRLMFKHPAASRKLHDARIQQVVCHPITLGGPTRAYSDGFLAVGDAASQVKPTTGGGIVFGMTCSEIATKVAHEALLRNDLSSEFLCKYQKQYEQKLGFDIRIMLMMRRILDTVSDRELDNMMGLCRRLSVEKTLQNIGNIDFQGHALLHVARSPRVLTVLGYFLRIYLTANH